MDDVRWIYRIAGKFGGDLNLAVIRTKLAPALTSRPPPNDTERELLALPARLGGIALSNPIQATDTEFLASTKITEPLKNAILQQNFQYTDEVVADQLKAKKDVYKMKRQQIAEASDLLKQGLPPSLKRSMELTQEKGASSWLTSLPIEELDLHFTRVPFMMHSPCVTTGNPFAHQQCVPVAPSSPLTMPFHALKVASLPSDTMKLGT